MKRQNWLLVFTVLTSHFVKLNTYLMAFRNHRFFPSAPPAQTVVEQSLKPSVVNGVQTYTLVDVDTSTRPPLPSPDDYRLSALLASGAPLNQVNPHIFENLELDAEHFITQNLVDDDKDKGDSVPRETPVPSSPDENIIND